MVPAFIIVFEIKNLKYSNVKMTFLIVA